MCGPVARYFGVVGGCGQLVEQVAVVAYRFGTRDEPPR